MNETPSAVVYFDIGGTLAAPRLSSTVPPRLERLVVFPSIPPLLQDLHNAGARLGIISNTGNETAERMQQVFEECGLFPFFDPALLVYSSVEGVRKDSPEIFRRAAARAGHAATPDRCVFVGEDSAERSFAVEAGLRAAPHPRLAREVLDGARLRYVRVTVPAGQAGDDWRTVIADLPIVPLHVSASAPVVIYAITSERVAAQLDDLGFWVDRLGRADEPVVTSLHLLHDDLRARTGFLDPQGQSSAFFADATRADWVLSSSSEGLFVALPAGHSIEELHFPNARHGHGVALLPDMTRLTRPGAALPAPSLHPGGLAGLLAAEPQVDTFSEITGDVIGGLLQRYTGEKPIDEAGTRITSRHINHPDNKVAVQTLADDFREVGGGLLSVRLQPFTAQGHSLNNVEAELEGEGTDEVVLVTAHLDSTAQRSSTSHPERDAHGADDDASGCVAALAAARAMVKRAQANRPKRTIRFVLFNGEEQGLWGSQAYAREQAELGAPIVAVFQMDMIGYNVNPPRSWELHVGVRAPGDFDPAGPIEIDAEKKSKTVAELVQQLSGTVSPLLVEPPIIETPDPGARRSDHYSFQERGYAACLAIEEFSSGDEEFNPNYHMTADTFVDLTYAADIARVLTAAAWITANA